MTTGRSKSFGRAAEWLLTIAAAGIATGVAINGMWRVFTDQLHLGTNGAVVLCAFLEVAMLVSAIRARRSLLDHGSVGVDGAAVWVMALISAVLASADAQGLGRAVRFSAPLVAAWLWERGLAAERRRVAGGRAIAWRVTRERVAVALGLAEPTARSTGDVAKSRLLARLTRARLRVNVLAAPAGRAWSVATARPVRLSLARRQLRRLALTAVEHLNLGTDPRVASQIRSTVAAVAGIEAATAPDNLAAASPWAGARPAAISTPTAPSTPGHSPAATAPRQRARRPVKRQVKAAMPAGLTKAEEDILVTLLGATEPGGWMKRADVIAASGRGESTVKNVLGKLGARGHAESREGGYYRAVMAADEPDTEPEREDVASGHLEGAR